MRDDARRLRLLSYNIQVGIRSIRPHHYLTNSWQHLLPTQKRIDNLAHIARVIHGHQIVGLQEVDAGSLRTGQVNLAAHLAQAAGLPFHHHQRNRNLGPIAQHGNALLSQFRPTRIEEHPLPGVLPGRGALIAEFGQGEERLWVVQLHLALGARTRLNQLGYVAEQIQGRRHVVVMGDLNCPSESRELRWLFAHSTLREPAETLHTYPSWRPRRNIDHILVTPELEVESCQVLAEAHSDHLPISMQVRLPEGLVL